MPKIYDDGYVTVCDCANDDIEIVQGYEFDDEIDVVYLNKQQQRALYHYLKDLFEDRTN